MDGHERHQAGALKFTLPRKACEQIDDDQQFRFCVTKYKCSGADNGLYIIWW